MFNLSKRNKAILIGAIAFLVLASILTVLATSIIFSDNQNINQTINPAPTSTPTPTPTPLTASVTENGVSIANDGTQNVNLPPATAGVSETSFASPTTLSSPITSPPSLYTVTVNTAATLTLIPTNPSAATTYYQSYTIEVYVNGVYSGYTLDMTQPTSISIPLTSAGTYTIDYYAAYTPLSTITAAENAPLSITFTIS